MSSIARLRDLVEFYSGVGFPNEYQGNVDGEFPFAKVSDISKSMENGDRYISVASNYVSGDVARKLRAKPFPKGTIVFAKIGEAIRKNRRTLTTQEMLFDNNVMGIYPDCHKIDVQYLMRLLDTIDFYKFANTTSVPSLRKSDLGDIQVSLPPLDEQKRIAAILDKADQLRQKRRQAIVLLDSLTQSIFLEMFGDPAFNPKGWPIKQIGDLLDSVNYGTSGKAGSNGEFPILRMGNVTSDGRIDVADLKYIDLNKVERPKYTVRRGDLLFNRTNSAELVGKTAVFDLEEEFAFAGYLVRARTNKEATPEFISAYLNSGYGKALLRGMAKSIVGMANINAKEMQRIEIPVPTIELQRQFSERLVRVKEMRQKFLPLQTKVEALFFSLQHRAFSGQL